jgi:two-component system chemotaxis response regulator CheY
MAPYRIFLIDDDRFLLDMYALKFKAAGHEVTAFQGGEAGLEGLRKNPAPDAVLIDIIMPIIDGFGVLEAVRKENIAPLAKFIVLSNQGQQEDIDHAKALGADGYIIKASAIPSEVFSETIRIIETPKATTA